MIELSQDVEDRLRAKAARSGQAVNDYLSQILEQPDFLAEAGTGKPEDYPREGENWTEEDLRVDLEWAMRQRPSA